MPVQWKGESELTDRRERLSAEMLGHDDERFLFAKLYVLSLVHIGFLGL